MVARFGRALRGSQADAQPPATGAPATAARIAQNPLITVDSSPSLGDNVNGPSIIRVPSWIPHPLGRYYAYFGHHKGQFIRLAYADAITGPWKIYEPGVVPVSDTAFYRPQPDPPDGPGRSVLHPRRVAGNLRRRSAQAAGAVDRMVGGRTASAGRSALAEARGWARDKGYGQFTQSSRVDRRDAFRPSPGNFEGQLSSRLPIRRLSVRHGPARSGCCARRIRWRFRDQSEPVLRRGVYANRMPGHVALSRERSTAPCVLPEQSATRRSGSCSRPSISPGTGQRGRRQSPVELLAGQRRPYECPHLPNSAINGNTNRRLAAAVAGSRHRRDAGKSYFFCRSAASRGWLPAELTFR